MSASSLKPYSKYRPTKTSDNAGGSTVVLGTPSTVYATTELFENQPTAIIRRESDVKVEDIIVFSVTEF